MIETFLEIYDLKDEKRTGWELRNIDAPESVADHSWGVTLLILNYAPENIDVGKALKIGIVHDIAEAEVGDIAKRAVDAEPEISEDKKEELEKQTIQNYSQNLDGNLAQYWNEYENRNSDEARFVKDMDLIDMCLQALKYEKQQRYDPKEENENFQEYENLDEFFATTEPRLNTEKGRELFQKIQEKYEEAKKSNSA